jgi:hypothetical protein
MFFSKEPLLRPYNYSYGLALAINKKYYVIRCFIKLQKCKFSFLKESNFTLNTSPQAKPIKIGILNDIS